MTVQTALFGSIGPARNMKAERAGSEILRSFYCAFGGLNSRPGGESLLSN